ncbi:hypothetical protein Q9233_009927 [Columba guinea]|nr:hypothetical protein Q9233_009927 [Columba guinea]
MLVIIRQRDYITKVQMCEQLAPEARLDKILCTMAVTFLSGTGFILLSSALHCNCHPLPFCRCRTFLSSIPSEAAVTKEHMRSLSKPLTRVSSGKEGKDCLLVLVVAKILSTEALFFAPFQSNEILSFCFSSKLALLHTLYLLRQEKFSISSHLDLNSIQA